MKLRFVVILGLLALVGCSRGGCSRGNTETSSIEPKQESGSAALTADPIEKKHSRRRSKPGLKTESIASSEPVAVAPVAKSQDEFDFQLIVNSENPMSEVKSRVIYNLFLKNTIFWNNHQVARPVDQTQKSEVRKIFSKQVLNRHVLLAKSYMQGMIASALPAVELKSDQAVIEYVKSHKNAVGYVSKDANIDGVKALTLVN
jgi:hypothetical protein